MDEEAVYRSAPRWLQTMLLNAHAARIHRHRFGAPLRRALARLEDLESWSPERIREWQAERLRVLGEVAYRQSRYWRQVFDAAGIEPSSLRGIEDLRRLPLLNKETLRSRLPDLLTASSPQPGWLHGHTSGTTGSPLELWYDRETAVLTNAVDFRQKQWAGMRPGRDWVGMFLGRVVVSPAQKAPPFWRSNFVHRQLWFSAFHMSEANLERYVDEIRRRGLRFLEGYPSTLFILSRFLERRGEQLPMEAVFSSSETLHAAQRGSIERAFGCRLFDFYGLAERVIFAGECGLGEEKHVAEEYGVVEIVDAEGFPVPDGTTGFVVGTGLHNSAMPLFRYRTSDVSSVRRGKCACGREGLLLSNIRTKAEDVIVTPDGRLISPSILTHPFKPFHQLLKSQIVQEAPDHLRVRLVPSGEFTAAHQQQLVASLRERLGDGVRIEVSVEADIPAEASGKFRWVISRVPHDGRLDWRQL